MRFIPPSTRIQGTHNMGVPETCANNGGCKPVRHAEPALPELFKE